MQIEIAKTFFRNNKRRGGNDSFGELISYGRNPVNKETSVLYFLWL